MDIKIFIQDCLLVLFLINLDTGLSYFIDEDYEDGPSFGRCPWIRNKLKNGRVRYRYKGRVAKFLCDSGYDLAGKRSSTCVRGQWSNPVPVCVARGCSRVPSIPNGHVTEMYRGALLVYDCNPGYTLDGIASIHCDGRRWSSSPPTCVVSTETPETSCDFESADLCGWSHDPNHDFDWKRNQFTTPSGHSGTGPSFDHTFGENKGGYYLYIEASSPRKINDTARLFSPVYFPRMSGGCFSIWYHMYGATTGGLRIYLKPESHVFDELSPKWEKFGNQGNVWNRGYISIPGLSESFQIVIEGVRGESYVGDSAIDDVSLTTEDCDSIANETGIAEHTNSESCRGRCKETESGSYCGCSEDCYSSHNCCSDYITYCFDGNDNTTAQNPDEGIQEDSIASKTSPSTSVSSNTTPKTTEKETTIASPNITSNSSDQTVESVFTPSSAILQNSPSAESSSTVSSTSTLSSVAPSKTPSTPYTPTTSTVRTIITSLTAIDALSTFTTPSTSIPPTSTTSTSTVATTIESTSISTIPSRASVSSTTSAGTVRSTTSAGTISSTTSMRISPVTSVMPTTSSTNSIGTTISSTTPAISTSVSTSTKVSTPQSTTSTTSFTSAAPTSVTSSLSSQNTIISSTILTTPNTTGFVSSATASSNTMTSISTLTTEPTTRRTYDLRPKPHRTTLPSASAAFANSTELNVSNAITDVTESPKTYAVTWKSSFKDGASTVSEVRTSTEKFTIWHTLPIRPFTRTRMILTTKPTTISTTKSTIITSTNTRFIKQTTIRYTPQIFRFSSTQTPFSYSSTSNSYTMGTSKTETASSNGTMPIVISLIAILICIAGGVAFYLRKQKNKRQSKLSDDSEMRFLQENEYMEYSDASVLDKILVK